MCVIIINAAMDSTALLFLWIKFLELRLLVKEYAVLRLLIFRARLSSGEASHTNHFSHQQPVKVRDQTR